MATIFTKIINKEIEADIVYEDKHVLAFNDVAPQAPIHILIIPKVEIATVNNLDLNNASVIKYLFLATKAIAKNMEFDEDGYRLVMNCNDDGGQSVYHIHLHLLAGRQLGWPPG